MNQTHDQHFLGGPARSASWLQRVLFIMIGTVFAITAFFFLAVAIAAGAVIALGVGLRWWWVLRRIRARAKASEALEGEYSVVEPQSVEGRPPER